MWGKTTTCGGKQRTLREDLESVDEEINHVQCSAQHHTANARDGSCRRVLRSLGNGAYGIQPGECAGLSPSLKRTRPNQTHVPPRSGFTEYSSRGAEKSGCGPEGLAHALGLILRVSSSLLTVMVSHRLVCKGQ